MVSVEKEIKNEEKKMAKFFSKKENIWMSVSVVLAIIVIVMLIVSMTGYVSKASAGKKMITYLSTLIPAGETVTLKSVKSLGSIYEITVDYKGQAIPVYMSKDGKYMINGDLTEINAKATTNTNTGSQTATEVPKSDKPKVDLYVMSFCPFGNQAEDTMYSVYNLLKSKVDFSVHYIVQTSGSTVNSLHGQKEVDQDMREACVLDSYGLDKWWKFTTYVNTNCGSDGSCWQAAAKNASLDSTKITSCVTSKGLTLMKANEAASSSANANGSPTLIINGVSSTAVYKYGNSEVYKQAICSAFNTAPSECSQTLGTTASASAGGSCGN